MKEALERFRISVDEEGMEIHSREGTLRFTAVEALMLLDVLKEEEETLQAAADKVSPLRVRMKRT